MANKKSFWEMHEAVGGSYSTPERAQQEQERNQKRQEKKAEIYRQTLENSAKRTEERRAAKQEQASQKAAASSQRTSPVAAQFQLLQAAAERKAPAQRQKKMGELEQSIAALQAQKAPLDQWAEAGNSEFDDNGQLTEKAKTLRELNQQIKEQQAHLDSLTQKEKLYQRQQEADNMVVSAAKDPDFASKSTYTSTKQGDGLWDRFGTELTMGYGDLLYEYINNQEEGIRDQIRRQKPNYGGGYDLMTDDEVALYNYYYSTGGKEAAQKYLDLIEDTVNQRKGSQMAKGIEGNVGRELLFGIGAGLDQFGEGIEGAISAAKGEDSYQAPSARQYASSFVREDLADSGAKLPDWLGGSSLGQSGYDVITNIAHMAPTLLASGAANALAPGSGAYVANALTAASSGGSAYQEAINQGYSADKARNYAAVMGASEAAMQYALGGIEAFGGKLSGNAIEKAIEGVGNGVAKAALKTGLNMASEGLEEGVQEALEPVFGRIFLGNEENVDWSQVAYSAVLGALTAGIMEGPKAFADARNVDQTEATTTQTPTQQSQDAQSAQQVTEAPLQGEPADPRQLARQQAEAREAAQVMEQEQQTQPARQEAPQAPTATDPLLEGIQTPVAPTQDQAPQQATAGREQLDRAIAETLGQNPDQQQAPTEVDTNQGTTHEQQKTADDSTAINTNPEVHTVGEQAVIDAYQAAVDENLVEYIEAVQNNQGGKMPKYPLTNVSDRAASDIKQLTGVDVAGDKVQIESRIIEHILKDHGENGISDHSMRDINDIARIQYVIDNYDSIEHGGTSSAYVYQNQNGRNAQAQTVVMKKKVNGTYFVVEAVPDTKKKTVYITSAYMSKDGTQKAAGSLSGDANAPRVTSQNATKNPTASDSSIPASGGNVNGNVSALGAQQDPYAPGIESVGAANRNFTGKTGYYDLLSDENSQPDRASDVRPMELPKTDINGNPISEVTGNVYGSDITSDEMASLMEEPVARGDFSYEEITNEKAKQMAAEKLRSAGNWDSALETWTRTVANGRTGAEIAARGALLLKHFSDTGDSKNWVKTLKYMQKLSTNTAQGLQAFRIVRDANDIVVSMDPISTAETAVTRIQDMEQGDTTFNQKKYKGSFEDWKNEVSKNITDIAFEIDSVQDGDTASMQQIIRKIAKQRKTTAWFGLTNRLSASANANLKTLQFSDLKVVADTQLLSMTDDFRRRSAGEVMNGIRKTSMLSAITTFRRNLEGNSAVGLLDSFGDSTTGAIMDSLLSKVTGKRTTGNDFFRGKDYIKAAKNSGSFASLCVELNIPIETDVEGSYASAYGKDTGGKYVAKTFRSTGNVGMRALYAYQKYQSYALEVSDKIFEGGTKGAVDASLEKLNGLNADERQRLADYTANRRTFKDATWEGPDNRTHGSAVSRAAQGLKNGIGAVAEKVGGNKAKAIADTAVDYVAPFVQVPTNVAQTGIDYSTGVLKGAYEMISLVEDARKGVEIPVERQRQAVSDFGRGTTGLGLIALATIAAHYGIIRVGDDDDKDVDALHQSEGRNGAQINWSAWKRSMSGESAQWQAGDVISSLDSVEPFNTHMYLGVELAQEDDFLSMMKAYPKATFESSFNAFMDSPMVSGLQEMGEDITELVRSNDKAETLTENLAEATGSYVSSYIPQFVRQTAQYTDGYYRDTRGNNKLETAVNQVKASIPGLSQTLPVKVNGLGEPQKRPGFTQTFLDPTKTTKYQPNDVTAYLDSLSEQTGDKSFYPEYRAPMSITVDGEKISLDGTQRTTYQTTYGNTYSGLTSELMNDATFNAMSPEIQAEIINRVRDIATQAGKASVSENVDAPEDTAQGIIRNEVKSKFGKAFDSLVDGLDNGGNSASGSQSLDQAYSLYTTLSADEQKTFRDDNGGRVGYFLDAKEAGVSTERFADLYSTYRSLDNNEEISAKEKAQQWSSTLAQAQKSGALTKAQANTLKDSMVFRTAAVATAERFDNLVESGMSIESAEKITHLLDGIKGTGKDGTVRPIDKYSAIASSSLSAKDKETALYEYMSDAMDEKYTYAKKNLGLTVDDFVKAYKVTDKYSLKDDQKKAWVAMGYTEAEAENLWKLYKGKLT